MSKTFARSSLCALSMTIMTAHAAEPPTNLDKPEGRLDIIAWPGYIERGQTFSIRCLCINIPCVLRFHQKPAY